MKKTPPAEGEIQILGTTSAQCNAWLDLFRVTSSTCSLERTVCVGEEAIGWNPFVLRSNLHSATPLVARQLPRTNPFLTFEAHVCCHVGKSSKVLRTLFVPLTYASEI